MQMMQGMQGMMRMMHQRAQSEQSNQLTCSHARLPNDPPNQWGRCGDAPNRDCARRNDNARHDADDAGNDANHAIVRCSHRDNADHNSGSSCPLKSGTSDLLFYKYTPYLLSIHPARLALGCGGDTIPPLSGGGAALKVGTSSGGGLDHRQILKTANRNSA